jgi:hypothetical protein
MDAIRKKMQSLKSETDVLMATIARFEGTPRSLTPNQTDMKLTFVIWAKKNPRL